MKCHFEMKQLCLLGFLTLMLAATSPSGAQSGSCQSSGKICVSTWQQDTPSEVCSGCSYRTGENLSESTITYSSIQNDNFGQLCSYGVDGQVYAQPMVVTNVTLPNQGTFDIAYVVTMNNTLYAFNATPGTTGGGASCPLLMHQSISAYLPSGQQTAVYCHNIGAGDCLPIAKSVGILSTPVVQPSGTGGTIYLVTYTQDSTGSNFYHYLHALDITTLQEKINSPVLICPPGGQSCPSQNQFSFYHIQRPGLLLADCGSAAPCSGKTYVYVAFSMMDGYGYPYPNGAIFGYNAANLNGDTNVFYLPTSVGQTSNASNGGGIWMGGAAPAFGRDKNGKNWIYLNTANGSFTLNVNGGTDAGDSFLKIDPNGLIIQNDGHGNNLGYLTPVDQYFRSSWSMNSNGKWVATCGNGAGDTDFGSGGVMLIPDSELPNWPQLSVGGDKEGGLWFIDRNTPGGFKNTCSYSPYTLCNCQPSGSNPSGNIQTFWTGTAYNGNVIRGGMAYWEYDNNLPGLNYAYAAQVGGQLFQYPLCAKNSASYPIDQSTCSGYSPIGSTAGGQAVNFPAGATPAVSADTGGASDAIVWIIGGQTQNQTPWPTQAGALYAFDALSMQLLYSSSNPCVADAINPTVKLSVPTVANGYVYLGTESANTNQQNQNQGTFYIFGPGRTGGTGC